MFHNYFHKLISDIRVRIIYVIMQLNNAYNFEKYTRERENTYILVQSLLLPKII